MDLKAFLFSLIVIYVAARVMGEVAVRLGQSAVLGELVAGILLGGSVLGLIEPTETLKLLGEVGVILLLFEVGLESDLQSFLKVGWSAGLVAVVGVVTPFLLGGGVALALGLSTLQAVFIGATLTATSVAITARVLTDLGRLGTPESNIILGAAVLDDILGLVVLSVVIGLAESGSVSWAAVGRAGGLSILLLGAAAAAGIRYAHLFSTLVRRMQTREQVIGAAMIFALLLAYGADRVQLAPLIGAFAAGLVLARTEHQARIQDKIKPVTDVFAPIFFVLTGAAVDLWVFNPLDPANYGVLALAGWLLVVAVAGKLLAGVGVLGRTANRWTVGIGMLPRGEVGLIFAGVGLAHGIIDRGQYGAILVVVTMTTLVSPIALRLMLKPRWRRVRP
jgi:Kef-type K+ transport system membrane component KefB